MGSNIESNDINIDNWYDRYFEWVYKIYHSSSKMLPQDNNRV